MNTKLKVLSYLMITLVLACNEKNEKKGTEVAKLDTETASKENLVARGEYLVSIMDCIICHTPKKMGEMARCQTWTVI